MMRNSIFATILTLFIAVIFSGMSQVTADPTEELLLRTDKSIYFRHELVKISVTNLGNEPVDLWMIPWVDILNEEGEEVYPCIHHMTVVTIQPGQTLVDTWGQIDCRTGEFVPAGTYNVETISELDPEPSTSFRIVRAVGGIWVPANKLELLAPWSGLASLIVFTVVATIVLLKKRRR